MVQGSGSSVESRERSAESREPERTPGSSALGSPTLRGANTWQAGGGAWKVAYADFVTAMMAFFLVMWITSQNDEVKKAIGGYFQDPWGTLARKRHAQHEEPDRR